MTKNTLFLSSFLDNEHCISTPNVELSVFRRYYLVYINFESRTWRWIISYLKKWSSLVSVSLKSIHNLIPKRFTLLACQFFSFALYLFFILTVIFCWINLLLIVLLKFVRWLFFNICSGIFRSWIRHNYR